MIVMLHCHFDATSSMLGHLNDHKACLCNAVAKSQNKGVELTFELIGTTNQPTLGRLGKNEQHLVQLEFSQ